MGRGQSPPRGPGCTAEGAGGCENLGAAPPRPLGRPPKSACSLNLPLCRHARAAAKTGIVGCSECRKSGATHVCLYCKAGMGMTWTGTGANLRVNKVGRGGGRRARGSSAM